MQKLIQIEEADQRLLAGIAATMDEALQRSGEWVVCKPGCTQCCIGPFAINALDAHRLRVGMRILEADDPERAHKIRERAAIYAEKIAPEYPGDPLTGTLLDEDALPESMDEVPCPALDPLAGTCDLYAHRPVTCRAFGPATRVAKESVGACELCYQGASDAEIAACAVEVDPEGLEAELLAVMEKSGEPGGTIVAYALLRPETLQSAPSTVSPAGH